MANNQGPPTLDGKGIRKPPSFSKPHMEIVTIQIGEGRVPFLLYKAFLIYYSPYFDKALTGNFQEASTGVVHLGHTTVEAFGLCVEWIMTQQIKETHITKEQKPLTFKEKMDVEKISILDLVRLWILADYLGMPTLQNKAIDMLSAKLRRLKVLPGPLDLKLAFEETMPGSMLRKFVVDYWCRSQGGLSKHLEELGEQFPKKMLVDMLLILNARITATTQPKYYPNSRDYHVTK